MVGGRLKNTGFDTMGMVGGGKKNKMAGKTVVIVSSKENGTKGEVSCIDGDEKTCLSSFKSNGWAGLGLVSGLDTV